MTTETMASEDTRLAEIRTRAATMTDERAAQLATEFEAYCGYRNALHENDDRKGRAPLFPNIWSQADWCAALVHRGQMAV